MNPVEAYLEQVRAIHLSGAGVPETSYYPALSNLFDEVGKTLNPRVRCILHPASVGAGLPDGGLFTADQLRRTAEPDALTTQVPARGAIEVKPPDASVDEIVKTPQLARYLERYRQVLVTNLRDFALFGRDADGKTVELERGSLAADERLFWQEVEHPRALAQREGARLVECLKRVMLHAAPLAAPQDLAAFLASYARDARMRLEGHDLPALASLRAALEEALGMRFEGEKGEHFFRSTLVQTLFYGIFSAWVIWAQERPREDARAVFDWRTASWSIELPVLRTLFGLISTRSTLQPLELVPLIDSACRALNRVDRVQFFARFEEGLAVQYFYEPFLQAFDPDLRKQLGVWYTPREIVQYQVARVDTVLREELEIADGLADPRVVVLDPCCGTGTYLVEVLKRIAETLKAKGGDALLANDLKRAAIERVFGFEILPAPFVVAHLQLGLLLSHLGAPLGGDGERVGVYLTNALTGWEPPKGPKQKVLPFPDLEEEREAAEHVKRDQPILVILGNPPYNGFAGIAVAEERDLSTAYRIAKRAPQPQGQGLNDLYVRFYRMAERKIVDGTGRGVVCFISNYSWLDGLSFTGMREHFLDAFDRIWIDNLHGDRIISEYAPDGRTSETVMATQGFSTGIKVGTAIALLARRGPEKCNGAEILYLDRDEARAADRRAALLASLGSETPSALVPLEPVARLGFPFKPRTFASDYLFWPLLTELLPVSFPGVKTSRDDVVVGIDRERLEARMHRYFDPAVSDDDIARELPAVMGNAGGFNARETRGRLIKRGFLPEHIIPYCYRPFDVRWLYWEPDTKLLDRKREDYLAHVFPGNSWLATTTRFRKGRFYCPQVTRRLADLNVIEANVQMFPLLLVRGGRARGVSGVSDTVPNLSSAAVAGVSELAVPKDALFFHALATMHAPLYGNENADALRQEWPRIPLPATRELLEASAALGRQVAGLLDPESDVPGISSGDIRSELRTIGAIASASGKPLDLPGGDLAVSAGWGHAGKGGVTMPGRGRAVERAYGSDERAAIEAGVAALGLSVEQAFALLGDRCLDVALNDRAYWRCVPCRVWEYTIGGYQVLKKWLSYRERDLLGRDLKPEEARYFMEVARRIAAILLLSPALDANYLRVKDATFDWRSIRGDKA
ncbi:MAG: DNA methyltransferase [Acidobacteria bacterium]|nr:MAG: DNA methyltransferase [Acidobacteriota bacterium]